MSPHVLAVHFSSIHEFSKDSFERITLLTGRGVEGDAHCGKTVQHRSRVARDPTQPNLRQVHLLQCELFDELGARGHVVRPGHMGENITTRGVDLLALPTDTELQLGPDAVVRLTGLRNPCVQIEHFQPGLMAAVLDRTPQGELVRKAGVMAVVVRGGVVTRQDPVEIRLPAGMHESLRPV